jgi:uncharacterized membrane-anchored protein
MTWLQTHRRLALFSVLVLVLALFVISSVVRAERRLGGLEIVLESRPVDPRDPLRGDYVILGYEAEDLSGFSTPTFRVGNRVYVEFEERGRYWEPITVRTGLPPRTEWPEGRAFVLARVESTSPLRVSYPDLGAYFIPQGTGDPPERPDVIVSVSDDGVARIKRLEIDGVPWPGETVPQDREIPAPQRPVEAAATPTPAKR